MRKFFLPGFLGLSMVLLAALGTARACVANGRLFSPPWSYRMVTVEVTGKVERAGSGGGWQITAGNRTFELESKSTKSDFEKRYAGKTATIVGRLEPRYLMTVHGTPGFPPRRMDRQVLVVDRIEVIETASVRETETPEVRGPDPKKTRDRS